ncbi:MAG TPA: amino acid adenylation domain-containing protein [Frateuria sp.]|uniref:non-ribosomal peptide synthetase n=1 Tax=Frateuria sp. TaxID=2211372 RepID=UPI002D7E76B0|nr:non-ribosomal peptide synthetase [Frateuria sp.]HET6805633.1 amino acid adenylation domain-containing protein [Frateuria sp.]
MTSMIETGAQGVAGAGAGAPTSQLSFAQERLWFIDKLADDKALYNASMRFALEGGLDREALERALREVVRRHEVLRTGFAAEDGAPMVVPESSFELAFRDMRDDPAPGQSMRRDQDAIASRPFDLGQPPLLRATLYRLGDERHELLLTVHHIIFDGASIDILLQELKQLYPAFREGRPSPLPDLPLQCTDAAVAERGRLGDTTRERMLAFWQAKLGEELPVLALPADRPRPSAQSFRGETLQRTLGSELVAAIEETCRRERITPFMLMLAAYSVWLCRYASQSEVVVGSPFALRGDRDTRGLIGFFVNTLALRVKVDGHTSFRQLLRQARQLCLEAYPYAEFPFGQLAAELDGGQSLAHAPVFQAMLAVQNRRPPVELSPGLDMSYLGELAIDKARFDVSMVLDFLQHETILSLEYSRDLFDPATANRMLDHFLVMLASALEQPDLEADRLPLMDATELAQWLEWSTLPVASVPDACLHHLFEQAAASRPDATALRCREQCLSYAELDERANRLAGFLCAEGVGPGELVGLCLPRTPAFVVAVLAVWKAGAAYVPLDPEQPTARHAYIVNDAGMRRVVTESSLAGHFADSDASVLCLDDQGTQQRIAASAAPPAAGSEPHDLAYAIYTSGSTGEPKGVLVEHRAVSRLLGSPEALGYDGETVMLQSINLAFDASVLETWAPLCRGGQLVLYPGQGLDVSALHGLIAEYGINTLTLPASLLDLWSEQWRGKTGLRRIVVGGEALSADTVARLYALDDEVVVINHYGPTENGVLSSYYPIPRTVGAPVPIGLPAPGTQLLVLNEAGQAQPAGVIGELYAAGQGLARGYLGRPDLTAEKFLAADPAIAISPSWYRTGDLVRWMPGEHGRAVLQFMGRRDQQVKIRGFRIELSEIEARLRTCPGVQDARVVVHRARSGDKQIVAYVIAATEARKQWRDRLQQTLPAYMVPAAFVLMPAWPLTQNGKLDLKALPAPDREAYTANAFAAPQTVLEATLLEIWQQLLKLERISIDDNFFEIGGHSLLATRLQTRIRARLGSELPVRAVFEAPTIRQLAARLDALPAANGDARGGSGRPLPPIEPMEVGDSAPLSHAQQRLWFIHRLDSTSAHYHIPFRLSLEGALDAEVLRKALVDLVARHAILRTVYRETGGEPRQVVLPPSDVELPTRDLSPLSASERQREAERCLHDEALRPFDLTRERPLRAQLLRMAPDRHWLAMTVHHIAADGWAMGILQADLAALYAAHRHQRPSPLPPMPLQYTDYAQWQRRWLDEAALETQLAFWQERLRGLPLLHGLPLDRPRPAVQTDRGAVHRQLLPDDLVARMQDLVQRHDATLFMGLYSAFALLLSRYSGESDIVVGTPVANRRDEALAPMVGLFVNTLVLRSDLSDDPAFVELLARSRAYALDAYEHQDLPFEMLVERINPARNASYSPLFQVMFALQNTDAAGMALEGLATRPIPFAERFAKFDLALNLQPQGGAILAEWEYNADLFDEASIAQMASSYRVLLEAILDRPAARAKQLPLLDLPSQQRVLALGNDTDRPYPAEDCLHTLIERHAERTPDAVAVIHGETSLSYAELNRQANRLAHHLRGLGVAPDVPVAVAMERSPALVVGLLAILKAGGAYVPLDAGYPEARLAIMLADSDPAVVLVDDATRGRIEAALSQGDATRRSRVIDVQTDAGQWLGSSVANPSPGEVGLDSSHIAYIIYTSGSTGRPKGVMNEHRAIVNRLRWLQEAHPLEPQDKFLQTAAIGFGASVFEIFWPLLAGAQVVLSEGQGHKDPGYLIGLILRERVSVLFFVPSMLQAFLDHPRARECVVLRHILCGGEPLPGALARRCRGQLPQAGLTHLYGSSETAVLSTSWDCAAGAVPDRVPIGTPGANTRIYILDELGRPVPRGVRGEIHVGGCQVARGYWRRPDLDAERFLPDPFHPDAGARMCRSGDLGRQLPDGSVEHLGRNDFQIKIRGQRVELGDIEAQLLGFEGIRQAVVLVREDGAELRLVAYLVPSDAAVPAERLLQALRTHLASLLPSHMLPAAYVVLPELPLNANGKLDRAALPVPDEGHAEGAVQPAETELQGQLLGIWQELLKQPRLGIGCDFFASGGHSLLALRLANRLREVFGYELELKSFFSAPTVRALAEAIQRHRQAQLAAQRFRESDLSDIVEF